MNQNTKIDTKLFQETEENNLYEALNKTSKEISGALKVNNYTKALTMLIELKDPIDSFFEKKDGMIRVRYPYGSSVKGMIDDIKHLISV